MNFFIPTAAAGNGYSLATFGRAGEIMGFFYPRIDYAQNIREALPAVRVTYPDGNFHFIWFFQDCWKVDQAFETSSNVLKTILTHRDLKLRVELTDVIPPKERALVRHILIDKGPFVSTVQFMHYFKLVVGDEVTRNGVVVHTEENTVVQHLRDIAIAVSGSDRLLARCGSYPEHGESDTKAAMEAGELDHFHQSIGRVDFGIGFEPTDRSRFEATIAMTGSSSPAMAIASARRLVSSDIQVHIQAADGRCNETLNSAGSCQIPDLAAMFDRAVLSLCDLFDLNTGAFVAAPEFDPGYQLSGGYGYCWPRDAAVCALAMHHIGQTEHASRFFEWSARTQLDTGHWYQRSWLDGSPAPSWCVRSDKIQLDQTCAVLHAAGVFARELGEQGSSFVEGFKPVAAAATHAILNAIGNDGLHLPASDLWENSVGSFAYTQAGVIAALKEADEVFGLEQHATGVEVRSKLKEKLLTTFWQPGQQRWLRRITPDGQPDATRDSSVMGLIYPWNVLDLSDMSELTLAKTTLNGINQDLRSEVKRGGAILRFENESYMGGGPGCVNTLWFALCRLYVAQAEADPEQLQNQCAAAMDDLQIALANTTPTGQLPELIPKMDFDYWAAPHAWACSLLIESCLLMNRLAGDKMSSFDAARARVKRKAPSS
jgi:GH15 family glucan-1,4-alpha-glucosidase